MELGNVVLHAETFTSDTAVDGGDVFTLVFFVCLSVCEQEITLRKLWINVPEIVVWGRGAWLSVSHCRLRFDTDPNRVSTIS